MNKAVLVIDMPDNCCDCPLCFDGYGQCDLCIAPTCTNEYGESVSKEIMLDGSKPDWCPLRELPEKESSDLESDEFDDGYVFGWNNCLDKFCGDEW